MKESLRSVPVWPARWREYLERGFYEEAVAAAKRYETVFGKGNYFLELQDHGTPAEQSMVNAAAGCGSPEETFGIGSGGHQRYPLHLRLEDAEAHDILLCIQTGKKRHRREPDAL